MTRPTAEQTQTPHPTPDASVEETRPEPVVSTSKAAEETAANRDLSDPVRQDVRVGSEPHPGIEVGRARRRSHRNEGGPDEGKGGDRAAR
ncbi:MAG TPA: hypothetical protein PKA20_08835 [Burkholderiaceae bacterium]|nr:hypothetical protein [Burkholderiaceae bacterium]